MILRDMPKDTIYLIFLGVLGFKNLQINEQTKEQEIVMNIINNTLYNIYLPKHNTTIVSETAYIARLTYWV